MRHLHIVPLLVEEALLCCRQLRNTLLQLLLAGAAAAETSDAKIMMAELYRRIHDTVCASQSFKTPPPHLSSTLPPHACPFQAKHHHRPGGPKRSERVPRGVLRESQGAVLAA
jgi:hypothetical protein